jgi:methylenetetrahydrofolate dehydrogenase (NADP+)/methenyltetrahydrofolate cyclohydrolase
MSRTFAQALEEGLLDGLALARMVRAHVTRAIAPLETESGFRPTLAVLRVGDDPASQVYVRHKLRAAAEVGMGSAVLELPGGVSQDEVLARIAAWNADPAIDGILVQLPLPRHLHTDTVLRAVDPGKDADGFHPANLGLLLNDRALLEPCTPRGVLCMLKEAEVTLRGCHAVVVGRSVIVGKPMAQLLLRNHATVTLCHSATSDLRQHVARADVLVVATGRPGMVPGAWIAPGAVVVDVGINRLDDGRLVGDVDFEGARRHARLITPVPGGAGPMTVAMLLWNTVLAARARRGLPQPATTPEGLPDFHAESHA